MLHLETEVFFHGVKGCLRRDAQSTRAAHIVRLQPEHRYGAAQVVGPPGAAGQAAAEAVGHAWRCSGRDWGVS